MGGGWREVPCLGMGFEKWNKGGQLRRMRRSRQRMYVRLGLVRGERRQGEEGCLRFSKDFSVWKNLFLTRDDR